MNDETDANGTEIPLSDWDAVISHLRECADECHETDDRVACEFGQGAQFAVSADGTVEAGMPFTTSPTVAHGRSSSSTTAGR